MVEETDGILWNVPIGMWRREKDNKAYPVIVMPRKESVYNCHDEPFETELELIEYCKKASEIFENAAKLFKMFGNGEIDHIYLFQSPKHYIKEKAKKNENLQKK